jgi:hypothetical protein
VYQINEKYPNDQDSSFLSKTQKENRAAILSLLENRCSVFAPLRLEGSFESKNSCRFVGILALALIMSFKDVLLQVFSQVKVIG